MAGPEHRTTLVDEQLPSVSMLLGPQIPGPLEVAAGAAGSRIRSARPVQVTWWPGRSITVRYRVESTGGALHGRQELVAVAGAIPDGAVVVEGREGRVGVWRVPHDPVLPGLAAALDRRRAGPMLERLGFGSARFRTRLRTYRPGRRAVVEIAGADATVYLKLVPRRDVVTLHRIHQRLAEHAPVPHSLGYDERLGLIALQTVPGEPLGALLDGRSSALPPAPALSALLRSLPTPAPGPAGRSPIEAAAQVGGLLARLLPRHARRIDDLVAAIGDDREPASIPVHGDFYENQILVRNGSLTGLLDVDTFGWGRPADDPATLLGHLSIRLAGNRHPNRIRPYSQALVRLWDGLVDPADVRRRAAAVALGLATGPFRVQRPRWPEETLDRLAVAERWVESARQVDERHLTAYSAAPHLTRPL